MAGSRIEKLGTVFSRVQGLLRTGAMKQSDKPVWYDVYAAFPPKVVPKYERAIPSNQPPEILYPEDKIRARFHKTFVSQGVINMKHHEDKTLCQRFIQRRNDLKASEESLDEEQLFNRTVESFKSEGITLKTVAELQEERTMSKKFRASTTTIDSA